MVGSAPFNASALSTAQRMAWRFRGSRVESARSGLSSLVTALIILRRMLITMLRLASVGGSLPIAVSAFGHPKLLLA